MKKIVTNLAIASAILLGVAYVAFVVYWNIAVSPKENTATNKPLSAEQMQEGITTDALYNAINEERVANNLTPYSRNPKLDESSKLKCNDMVAGNYYDHKNPTTNKDGYSYIEDLKISSEWISENLNQGYFNNAKEVIDSWMQSESHKASIIDPKFTEIGFATCIVPQWPDELTIVQHKIEPAKESTQPTQNVQNNYYSTPRRSYSPTTTTCTYNDYGGYFSPTATCKSY